MNLIATLTPQCSFWLKWLLTTLTSTLGLTTLFDILSANSYLHESLKLLILGSLIEAGRRLFQWFVQRFKFQYFLSARFNEGDPAYEWLVLFLTEEKVWNKSRDFIVTAKSSKRKWAVVTSDPGVSTNHDSQNNAEYVPSFSTPHLFRWNGHWIEITQSKEGQGQVMSGQTYGQNYNRSFASLQVTIYSREMAVLSALVEDACSRYINTTSKHVTIFSIDSPNYGLGQTWSNAKARSRRPLESLILEEGVVEALISDAREFLGMDAWYADAGIPHRRGYLLYGPPGTGKTSTVYAIAGELNLEIYTLSLASNFIDDPFLLRAVSSIPKQGLLLIEDIDCAFLPRLDDDDSDDQLDRTPSYPYPGNPMGRPFMMMPPRSKVTLSCLLNVIDGVNSENGKLFFATTNHINHLDPALLRPGRVDKKIQYRLATKAQARALYLRFFPEARFAHIVNKSKCTENETGTEAVADYRAYPGLFPNDHERLFDDKNHHDSHLSALASQFADHVPEGEFSTAELQGYLLTYKMQPLDAVNGIAEWVRLERAERQKRAEWEGRRKGNSKAKESTSNVKANNSGVVADLVGSKITTHGDTANATELSNHSIPPSGANGDVGASSPQTTTPVTATQLDSDPNRS